MNSCRVLLLFLPFLLNGGVSKAGESQELPLLCRCNKVLVRRHWQREKQAPFSFPVHRHPHFITLCLLLHASFEVLRNQPRITAWQRAGERLQTAGRLGGSTVSACRRSCQGLADKEMYWTRPATQHSCCCSLVQRGFSFPPCSPSFLVSAPTGITEPSSARSLLAVEPRLGKL